MEEADQPALARLERQLRCKVGHSELLDDLKDVDLAEELLLGTLLQSVLPSMLRSAAQAYGVAEEGYEEVAPVGVSEYLTVCDGRLQPIVLVLFLVLLRLEA